VARHIFQAYPVWIYTQSNITSIIFTWVHHTNTEKNPSQIHDILTKLRFWIPWAWKMKYAAKRKYTASKSSVYLCGWVPDRNIGGSPAANYRTLTLKNTLECGNQWKKINNIIPVKIYRDLQICRHDNTENKVSIQTPTYLIKLNKFF
jgi:hypothetical protein